MGHQIQFPDIAVCEDRGNGHILGQLGLSIDTVAVRGYQLYRSFTFINHLKKFVYICDILDFHIQHPPFIC